MKTIKPSVEAMHYINGPDIVEKIEACGRVCYKSEHRIEVGSARPFVQRLIKAGHEAVLEHASVTLKFICDRGVSHELVRHRMASYCQESTRYCNYEGEQFGGELTVIRPCYLTPGTRGYSVWEGTCMIAEESYFDLLDWGCTPQQARAVLPNSLKTEVVITANLREWRHILKLRCHRASHPQMREVALMALKLLYNEIPVVFTDLYEEYME